jgi:hypothetical protein
VEGAVGEERSGSTGFFSRVQTSLTFRKFNRRATLQGCLSVACSMPARLKPCPTSHPKDSLNWANSKTADFILPIRSELNRS